MLALGAVGLAGALTVAAFAAPDRAARATPLSTALGTEMASAQGLAATNTAMLR